MNPHLNFLLARCPPAYRAALRWFGNTSVETLVFLKLVRNGDVVFDIGGNRGHFTVLFSHVVGARGAVHVFEPVPTTTAALAERLRRELHFQNVVLNGVAIGETRGTATIYVPGNDDGQASMAVHSVGSWASGERHAVECSVVSLDLYVLENAVDRIDFIKLDIEGAELHALTGARATLSRFKPVVHFEFFRHWAESFGYDARQPIEFLRTLGYTFFYRGDLIRMMDPIHELNASSGSEDVIGSVRDLA